MRIRCNKCQYSDEESEFPKGRDFFQNSYISGCPKCDNRQSPGNASMRMFGGNRPFVYITDTIPETITDQITKNANEAS